jgi:hypothetical protein
MFMPRYPVLFFSASAVIADAYFTSNSDIWTSIRLVGDKKSFGWKGTLAV